MRSLIHKSLFLCSLFYFTVNFSAQTITGKIVDEYGEGIYDVNLHLYYSQDIITAVSDSKGLFSFNLDPVNVINQQLPAGYSISNNYPNPFNPITRFVISIPKRCQVKLNLYNPLGEKVEEQSAKSFDKGINYWDLELNGLANGVYFARITIDNKYTVVRKLMLIYGSQHLSPNNGTYSNAYNSPRSLSKIDETIIDSLVAENKIIGSKTFIDLPGLNEGTTDLGELTIVRSCPEIPRVEYEGIVYNTVQIGDQCWLRENLNIGTMIPGIDEMKDNDTIEKYCQWETERWCDSLGGLYLWDEAMQYSTSESSQGICPEGWHIPATEDFQYLIEMTDGKSLALQSVYTPGLRNPHGTNQSGFSSLLTGYRQNNARDATTGFGISTFFWSSSEIEFVHAKYLRIHFAKAEPVMNDLNKSYGFCIRCIKD